MRVQRAGQGCAVRVVCACAVRYIQRPPHIPCHSSGWLFAASGESASERVGFGMSYGLAVPAAGRIVTSPSKGVGAGVMVGSMVGAIVAIVRVNEDLAVVSVSYKHSPSTSSTRVGRV